MMGQAGRRLGGQGSSASVWEVAAACLTPGEAANRISSEFSGSVETLTLLTTVACEAARLGYSLTHTHKVKSGGVTMLPAGQRPTPQRVCERHSESERKRESTRQQKKCSATVSCCVTPRLWPWCVRGEKKTLKPFNAHLLSPSLILSLQLSQPLSLSHRRAGRSNS